MSRMHVSSSIESTIPGAKISTFEDSVNALSTLFSIGNQWPGVIILDYQMPRMNGKDFCDLLSEFKFIDYIKVIVRSSRPDSDLQVFKKFPFVKKVVNKGSLEDTPKNYDFSAI